VSTQQGYVDAIEPEEIGMFSAKVTLNGDMMGGLVDGIEWGMKPFNLRTTVLKGRKFVRIPFDYNITKGATGVHGQIPGRPYTAQLGEAAAAKLGDEVRAATRTKEFRFGGSLSAASGGPKLITESMRKLGIKDEKDSWHSTGIYTRMIRGHRKTAAGGIVSSHKTFRTLSVNSMPPESWQHPGLTAKKFHLDVVKFIEDNADMVWGS